MHRRKVELNLNKYKRRYEQEYFPSRLPSGEVVAGKFVRELSDLLKSKVSLDEIQVFDRGGNHYVRFSLVSEQPIQRRVIVSLKRSRAFLTKIYGVDF